MRVRPALIAALLGMAVTAAFEASAASAPRLEHEMTGEAAVQALGDDLPAVAAKHGMPAAKFARILREDATARLDRTGRLYYVEPALDPSMLQAKAITAAASAPAYPLDTTFQLHSHPVSSRVIYLDFNGQVVTNTAWASGAINAPAFDLDGDPSTFSDDELAMIQGIWQRVSEDYAPFDVDVTTEEPSATDLSRIGDADTRYGTRAVITNSAIGMCTGCGGVAYVGVFDDSFDWAHYQPAWIFHDKLAEDEKDIAEAISHEVGHNLGLNHDGTSTDGYYEGHGSGATGWAPIMGAGYYKTVTQWSKGEYPDANNQEDDLSIIPAHGATLRADDHGSSLAAASALSVTAQGAQMAVDQGGVIEQASDTDWFVFTAGAGSVQLSIGPGADNRDSNLDVLARLLDAAGNLVASSNDPDDLAASLSATLAGGTYYVEIDGVGDASPLPGYSDYGSLGRYRITGTYAAPATADPEVSLDVDSLVVPESAGTVSVGVNLSAPSSQAITVPFALTGKASASKDFTMPSGTTLTLAPGVTAGSFDLAIANDTLDEATENVIVTMGTPTHATAGAIRKETIQIRDNDPAPTVSFSRASQSFPEGRRGTVDLVLSAASAKTVKVNLTASGTATAGTDYRALPVQVTFPKGVTSKRVQVQSIQDASPETAETVVITIDSAVNATKGATTTFTATIRNDD